MDPQKCVAVCRGCSDDVSTLVVPFVHRDARDEWAEQHHRSTGHGIVCADGWCSDFEARALLAVAR